MSRLFEPLTIGALTLPNRIVVAPMCQYSAEDGAATDWHLMHLGQLAISGAGLLILEATAVSPEGRISAADLGLYSDACEAALARVLAAVRRNAPIKVAMQLSHAGRKASTGVPWDGGGQVAPDAPGGWHTLAPSPVPHVAGDIAPQALDRAGMDKVCADFAAAAARAAKLGLDGIELHFAHGYLLNQFLSPLANSRDDAYGGSREGRMRFPIEVFQAVRAAFPAERPVWVRISATDWVQGGWDVEDTVALVEALRPCGVAGVSITTGGVSTAQVVPLAPGYQVGFAARVKAATGLPTMVAGLITEPEQAEAIIAGSQADAVALARAMLYDPRWPWHAAARLGAHATAPKQYLRSQPREHANLLVRG